MEENRFPPGWDEERVKKVVKHYEQQTEEEAVAEDEAALEDESTALVPAIREIAAEYQAGSGSDKQK